LSLSLRVSVSSEEVKCINVQSIDNNGTDTRSPCARAAPTKFMKTIHASQELPSYRHIDILNA